MLQEKTVINDCYILQSEIGEDSYTEHWIATAIFSAKHFLLRFLREGEDSPERVARLREDSVRSYRVRGPAIADFIEIESYRDRTFISSELNAETSLLREIECGRQWSISQILNAMVALADGLASFHALGISYGNLNAESVIITERGSQTPILKIRKPSMIALLPLSGANPHDVAETYGYIAPEYKSVGEGALRPESDIYSMGVHLFRLITGTLPFPDDSDAIRTAGPSLRYAAIALARCGMPERLVGVVIKALMGAPDERYGTCNEFIDALRAVLSSLKEAGGNLPIQATIPGGAFERTDYFTSLSGADGPREGRSGKQSEAETRRFPERTDGSARTGSEDFRILPEESGWSVDDYVSFGFQSVFGDNYRRETQKAITFGPIEVSEEGTRLGSAEGEREGKNAAVETPNAVAMRASVSRDGESVMTDRTLAEGAAPAIGDEGARDESPSTRAKEPAQTDRSAREVSITQVSLAREGPELSGPREEHSWTRHRIRIVDIKAVVARASKRAESGHGTFRYIEEPQEYFAPNGLFDLLASFADGYLYVNAGSFTRYGIAETRNFAEMLSKGFARALTNERPGSRRYLSRRLSEADPDGVLVDRRLAEALGVRRRTPERSVDWRSDETRAALVAAIRAFSRKSRPLVLVVRGGESVSRDLHDLLSLLAGSVDRDPVAVFVFFGRLRVEPWHALSRLVQKTG
jgi:serine/threonine protein kinase